MSNQEEKVNKEFLYVLDRIKELSLKTPANKPIDYWIEFLFAVPGVPMGKDQSMILEKLEEMEVLKIINPGGYGEYE